MSIKILAGLCVVLSLVASAEAVLLVRNHWEQKKMAARNPFQMMQRAESPDRFDSPFESFFGRGFRDKFFRDFDHDSFFTDSGEGFFERFHQKHFGSAIDQAVGKGFGETFTFQEPKWEEHGKEMRMVVDIKGHEQGDYSVNVSGEQVTFTGKNKSSQNENGMTQESHWSNTQSFPLPPEVDPKGFRVERTQDKFIVIFKKREFNGATST